MKPASVLCWKCTDSRSAHRQTSNRHVTPARHAPNFYNVYAIRNLEVHTRENKIKTLNVAGSRGSKEPGVVAFVKQALEDAFCPRAVSWLGGAGEG